MIAAARADEALPGLTELNDSEASNLSFIVSHRFERNAGWRFMMGKEENEASMAELAERVSKRMEELSLRLADEKSRAELGPER